MEVRLVVKEVKRTSYACDVCKKRKGKCSGGSPCAYCTEHGIACSYLKANKKRGPAKKQKADNQLASSTNSSEGERQLVTTSGPRPLLIDDTLTLDLEKLNLVDMYVDFAEDTHLFTNKERLLHPTTIGQRLMTTAVLGLMSKANGCFARAEQYISDARTLAVQAMEETSVEAAIAFTVLAVCFPMRDRRHTLYANMAHGIAKTLPGKNVEEKKMYEYSLLGTTMLDASMDVNLKRKVLLTQVSHIMAFKDLNPRDILAAVMTRLYCNLLPKMMDHLTLIERPWLLTQVTLTDDEKNNLLSDIHVAEWVIDQHNSKLGKIKELYVYSIKVLKVIILWRSGDIEGAIREADFPTKYSLEDTVNLRVVNDLQYVWLLSLFYFSVGVPEPAETLYTRFTVLCERYGQPFLMEFLPHPSKIVSRVIELESISPIPDLCRPLPTPSVTQNNSPPQAMATSPQGSPQQPTSPNPNTPPQDLSRNTSSSSMEKSPPTSPEYLNTPSPTINPTPTVPITNATIIAPASSPLCTTTKSITDYSALLAVSDPQTPSYAVQNIAKLDEPIINIPLQHQNQQHQQQYQQQQNQRQHQPTPQPQQPQNEAETLATTTKFVTQYLQTIIQDGNQTQRQPNQQQQQQTQPQQVNQQMWQQPTDTQQQQQRQPPIPQLAQIPQAHMHILQKAQEHKQTQNYTTLTFPPQQQQPLTQQHFPQQPPQQQLQQQQIYQPQQFSTQQYTQYQQPQQQIPSPQQQSFAQPQQYNTISQQQQQPSPQQYTQQPSPPQQYNQQPSPTQQYVQQQPSPPQQYTQPTSQQYTQQPSPPQQYSTQQPSPPQQQYAQPSPQQYIQQTSPPQQQYSQPSPPQQQQYSQSSPQQYTQQPSPPQQYVQTQQPQPQQYVQPQQTQQPQQQQQQYTQIQAYPQPAHTPEVQHMITQCNKLHDTLRDQMEDRIAQRKLQIKAQMQQAPPPIQPHQQTQYPGQQQPQQLPFQQQQQPQLQPTPFQPQQTQQPQLQQTQQTQQATYINTTIEEGDRRLSFSFLDDLLNLE